MCGVSDGFSVLCIFEIRDVFWAIILISYAANDLSTDGNLTTTKGALTISIDDKNNIPYFFVHHRPMTIRNDESRGCGVRPTNTNRRMINSIGFRESY